MNRSTQTRRTLRISLAAAVGVCLLGTWWYLSTRNHRDVIVGDAAPVTSPPTSASTSSKSVSAPPAIIGSSLATQAASSTERGTPTRSASYRNVAPYVAFSRQANAAAALAAIETDPSLSPADRLYFAAMIAELCSQASRENTPPAQSSAPAIVATNSPRDGARALLAMRKGSAYCAGSAAISSAQVAEAWDRAARAGSTAAQARLAWTMFEKTFTADPALAGLSVAANQNATSPERWNRAMIQTLVNGLSSKDPAAIVNLGAMLQMTSHTDYLALSGPQGLLPLADLPVASWHLIACDYGLPCGPENTTLLAACANLGKCDSQDLSDYYRRYVWTPEEAARFDLAAASLRALIDQGNPALLQIIPFDQRSGTPPHRFVTPIPRPYRPPS